MTLYVFRSYSEPYQKNQKAKVKKERLGARASRLLPKKTRNLKLLDLEPSTLNLGPPSKAKVKNNGVSGP
jgi:hypothetical protein